MINNRDHTIAPQGSAAAFVLAIIAGCSSYAQAGFSQIAPGGSATIDALNYQQPVGTVVAQSTTPFTAHYQPDGRFVDFSGTATGEVTQTVIRDPATSQLTFLYGISLDNEGITSASEGSDLKVKGFASFQTGVSGTLQFEQLSQATRSRGGNVVELASNAAGLGGPPMLAVRTDADHYNNGGTLTYALADEFTVRGPFGQELDTVGGQIKLSGVYQPVADTSGTPGMKSVPLPPAFFSGLGIMLACGLISVCRRTLVRAR